MAESGASKPGANPEVPQSDFRSDNEGFNVPEALKNRPNGSGSLAARSKQKTPRERKEGVAEADDSLGTLATAKLEPRNGLGKSKVGKIWAAIVTLVTLATAIISVVPVLFKDESSAQSLKITIKPFRSESVSHFALPVGVPVESFPVGGKLCTSEQEEWLDQHGVRFQRDYVIDMRNSAGGGSSLAVGNVRGVAETTSPASSSYIVECDKAGDAGIISEPGRLLLDTGEAAFFDKTAFGMAGTGQPNSPLAYNLRPGETGQVVLSFSARSNFSGEVVVSVSVGDQTSDVKVPLSEGAKVEVPGVVSPRTILVTVQDGLLQCNVIPNPTAQVQSCDSKALFKR